MLAYMNAESVRRTLETGTTWFFSRSRNEFWNKGATSGHFQKVRELRYDCDGDTLLIRAQPDGPTCHRGTTACFDTPDEEGFIRTLQALVADRHEKMPEGSYTTKLFIKGPKAIGKKVIEEAGEAVIEAVDGMRGRFIYEASDLIYHLLVLLEQQGVSLAELERELVLRHQ